MLVVRAEPSPDSLVGIAASGAPAGSIPGKATEKLSAKMAEAVGKLGDRTPTIQLLRDGLYRACEAYMNGIFTKDEYIEILYGFDEFVVTLFAIEGLTHRSNPSNSILQGQTDATISHIGKTDAKNSDVSRFMTIPSRVNATVATTIKEILFEYYDLQRELYGLDPLARRKQAGKRNE